MFLLESAPRLLKDHLLAILLAIVVSLASGLPEIYLVHAMGENYRGVFPEISGDQLYYDARAQESRDGYPQLGNPYILELREAPGVSFWMPDAIISKAGQILGLDVQHTFAFFNFILPPILFLVTYLILLTATKSRTASILGAALFHLGLYIESFIRSPSPQFNFLFIELAFLAGVWFVLRRPYAPYALTATLGVLFYVYPYFWTFMFGVVGMFFLVTLLTSHLKEYRALLFFTLCGAVMLGSPTLIQMLQMTHVQAYQETILRLGMIHSRTPAGLGGIAISAAVLLGYTFFIWKNPSSRLDKMFIFMFSAVLGGILASNNHIVTGNNLEFSSHYFLPVVYTAMLAATYLIASYAGTLSWTKSSYIRPTAVAVMTCCIAFFSVKSLAPLVSTSTQDGSQKYGPIIMWVKVNIPPEKVVLTGRNLGDILPGYSSARIFYSRNANLHVMTDEEAWTRFILQYWDEPLTDEFLNMQIGAIWGAHYYDEYGRTVQLNKLRKVFGQTPEKEVLLPETVKASFRSLASDLRKKSADAVLGDRKIDYAITEPGYSLPSWLKILYPDMQGVHTIDEFTVYELGPRMTK